jgi:hypothetical protein
MLLRRSLKRTSREQMKTLPAKKKQTPKKRFFRVICFLTASLEFVRRKNVSLILHSRRKEDSDSLASSCPVIEEDN